MILIFFNKYGNCNLDNVLVCVTKQYVLEHDELNENLTR